MSLIDRRTGSYNKALITCEENDCTPLFDFEHWYGQTENFNGSTRSIMYDVKCKCCGKIYQSWFKLATNRMTKCPNCYEGHKDKGVSYQAVLNELESIGLQPCFSEEDYSSKNNLYKVKCIKCGLEFETKLIHNHINNCPYCSSSKAVYNQLNKLRKVCDENSLDLLDDKYITFSDEKRPKYKVQCRLCGTIYETTFVGHNVINCPVCCERKYRSSIERRITAILKVHNIQYYANYRLHGICMSKGHPFELDLFIPSKNIAFEFNGQAYHNSGNGIYSKDRNYHKRKTELCLEHGIKLYHLWDFTPFNLCESVVKSKLGLSERIYARDCELRGVSATDAKKFFNECHVDGYIKSNKYFGLFYQNKLVCCISLLKRNIQSTKEGVWEIGRFASLLNLTVVGGYSRLLKESINYLKSIGESQVISYCNRDLAPDPEGTFYAKQGFQFIGDSGKIYWYWSSRVLYLNGKRISHSNRVSRQDCQKSKLIKDLQSKGIDFDDNMSEIELAGLLGLYPCYNSGNFKYLLSF